MADRYQERPFPADDYDRGANTSAPAKADSDPLAELAETQAKFQAMLSALIRP